MKSRIKILKDMGEGGEQIYKQHAMRPAPTQEQLEKDWRARPNDVSMSQKEQSQVLPTKLESREQP